ncbi:hypothetical protein HELRODRAFT_194375 [Helobdella robusta]|uniref:B box-type domain-containing protein n=1 Tax=Helobdella robusta TaxID=6412 RepID=T1FVZ9_HELRO|nr:hypothetical protein HELRODRAFT_194375 [Helobdella robusta]ESN92101.1 hypothetical protein HELRODRAFT_194375 [Helobdella robusta]
MPGLLGSKFGHFLHPHYIGNLFLSVVFFILKTCEPFCSAIFEDCQLELREWELMTFMGCVIVMKNRKTPSYSLYIQTVCMFAKMLSSVLFLRQNPLYGALYIIACFCMYNELERDRRIVWLIEFYTAWAPTCGNFAPQFAELSAKFSLDNLKFGKMDVTRFPDVAKKFNIDISSWSKQLPTVILFQQGKEFRRRPAINSKGKLLAKFVFCKENIIRDFELSALYQQCKSNPLPINKRKEKRAQQEKDNAESSLGDVADGSQPIREEVEIMDGTAARMEFGGRKSKTPFSLQEFENAPIRFLQESLVSPSGADQQSSSQSSSLDPSEDVPTVVQSNVESNIVAGAAAASVGGGVETFDLVNVNAEKEQNIDPAADNSQVRQEPCTFNCLYCLKNNRLRIEENNMNAVSSEEKQNPESLSNENEPTTKTQTFVNIPAMSFCEICGAGCPERFCLDCGQHICVNCLVWHNKFKANISHNVCGFFLSDRNKFNVAENPDINKKNVNKKCSEHKLLQLNVYCLSCDVYVCAQCYVDQHRDHKTVYIRIKLHEEKLKLESLISWFKTSIAEHVRKSKAFKESTVLVDKEEEEVTFQIKSRANKAKNEISKYVEGLLIQVNEFYADYRQQRMRFMHESEVSLSTMISKLTFLESCLSDLDLGTVTEIRDDSDLMIHSWTAFQLTHEGGGSGGGRVSSSTFSNKNNVALNRCHTYESPQDLHEAIHQLLAYIGDIQF